MPQKTPDVTSALYAAADRKAWRSGLRAAIFLAVALVAAVGSAFLLTRYIETRTAAARVPTAPVLVASTDLLKGTEIRPEHLQAVAWPAASVPTGTFQDPKELLGKIVADRLYKGEAILQAKLSGGDKASGLSALLPEGMRAAAVRVDDVVGVAGFIHPGDSVDVIATLRSEGPNSMTSSKIILQNIKVLAVGKELDHRSKGAEKVVPATVATLMVDAEESERLALAAAQGKILLTLRSSADPDIVVTKGVHANTLLATNVEPSQVTPSAKAKPPKHPRVAKVAKPTERPDTVEIIRGNLFEQRKFEQKGGQQ